MLALAREFLARKEIAESRLDAELLVAHALGLDRLHLFLRLDQPVTEAEVARARELLVRRSRREPVAYITGEREFYGRRFEVTRQVLIPRPETEHLVDQARAFAKSLPGERLAAGLEVADIGTGSGCLAITLALELTSSRVSAVDISYPAIECAQRNAERLGARVRFVEGDGPRAPSSEASTPPFDLIVSNPPYIDPAERGELAPEVRDFEPPLALFLPPNDPLHWLRRLADEAVPLLAPGGALFVELGHRQAPLALDFARERALDARTHKDFAGIERVLELRRHP
jgi:release factor glutamine methyltransferase